MCIRDRVMVWAAPMIAIVGGTETTFVVAIAMISPMWGATRESSSTGPRSSLPGILRSRSDALWLNPFPCMCHLSGCGERDGPQHVVTVDDAHNTAVLDDREPADVMSADQGGRVADGRVR